MRLEGEWALNTHTNTHSKRRWEENHLDTSRHSGTNQHQRQPRDILYESNRLHSGVVFVVVFLHVECTQFVSLRSSVRQREHWKHISRDGCVCVCAPRSSPKSSSVYCTNVIIAHTHIAKWMRWNTRHTNGMNSRGEDEKNRAFRIFWTPSTLAPIIKTDN